jgi:uncharacterized membrane protein YciS (DUF1049 family)
MKFAKIVILGICCLAIIVVGVHFGVKNNEELSIYFFGKQHGPFAIWEVAGVSFLIGVVVSLLFFSYELTALGIKVQLLRRKVNKFSKQQESQALSLPEADLSTTSSDLKIEE